MKKNLSFLVMFLLLIVATGSNAFAQKQELSGTILNSDGLPIQFASIQVKGTTRGATSNEKGEFKITSSRFGPHHGPQGTLLQGVGAYEGSGAAAYPAKVSSTHVSGGACVTCHMGDKENAEGGHDWFHVERVFRNSILIAKDADVNAFVVSLARIISKSCR